ncbi:MAG TPA: RHS repeat-associated core domain-containing protein, partial [Pyrinomonadaceae bacterium]|nr:RHS repeat-associated core domain-containing protein [Pyrinomonadaceae bacterium]
TLSYAYDALNRITDIHYPAQYGNGNGVKVVHHDYDVASRVSALTYGGQSFASSIVYNAANQTTQMRVGASGANQIIENYGYATSTGLLDSQTIARDSAPSTYLLNLSYEYTDANNKRTGQLKKILNNLNHNKDRSYDYDALRRLKEAKGGPSGSPLWTQTYAYDRYGNRTSVTASGYSAKNERQNGPTRTDLLAKNFFEPPAFMNDETKAVSDSPVRLFPANTNTGAPDPVTPFQGAPPTFTDDPLATNTIVKALHVTELRDAINALRLRAGIATVTWAEAVSSGVSIKASHITEMRTRLGEARTALSLGATTYTDPSLTAGAIIKKQHIQEIRDSLKSAWTVSSQISVDGHASLTYDAASNRITTSGFAYDTAGNQVRALIPGGTGSQRYQYDAANRLVNVKTDDGSTVIASYTYGHSSARLIETVGTSRTYFVSDNGTTVAEFSESGAGVIPNWSRSYVYIGARLLSTLAPNGGSEAIEYHHPDRLGARLITTPTGGSSENAALPFGTVINSETTANTTRRFISYDRSGASKLDYAINRQYDWQQGRFTQVDPIGMQSTSIEHPQSLNLYAYVNNDPVNNTDPDGLGLKSFFKKLGRIFSAIGNAIAKVLNNRWVKIGIMIASFLVGVPSIVAFLGRTITAVIKTALTIHDVLSNAASTLQLYGMLFQGKFKEFGRTLGIAMLGAAIATLEDSIIHGVKQSVRTRGSASLRNIWLGVKEGFATGRRKLLHNLFGRGWLSLIPFYGNFCSPGNVDGAQTPGVDAIDKTCKWHDDVYQGHITGVSRYEADKVLFKRLFYQTAKTHLTDRVLNLAFGTKIFAGDVYRSLQIVAFANLIGYRAVTGRGK